MIKRAMLSVFIFSQVAVQVGAIFLNPKHNAAGRTPLRTHVLSKGVVNAKTAVQIASHQGRGEYELESGWARRRRRTTKTKTVEKGILIHTIENSPLCRTEYPNLELWAGTEGDRCRTVEKATRTWSCPEGCLYAGERNPYCFKAGTRDLCAISATIHAKCQTGPCLEVCRYPHEQLVYHTNQHPTSNKGDYCKAGKYGNVQNWFPPKGCEIQGVVNALSAVQIASLQGRGEYELESGWARRRRTSTARRRSLFGSLLTRRRRTAAAAATLTATIKAAALKSAQYGFPYTWVKGKTGWATGTVCHVDSLQVMANMPQGLAPDNTIRGVWRLVASSTHGASVGIQTGFTSSDNKAVTEEEVKSFSTEMSVSATVTVAYEPPLGIGLGGEASATVGASTSKGGSSSIASTAMSAVGQSETEMITVQCPDEQQQTAVTSATDSTSMTASKSLSMEYVYQWVVGNAKFEAKTQHFRCHRVADGIKRDPQCPPQFCGNPALNPYCVKSSGGQQGADPNCG